MNSFKKSVVIILTIFSWTLVQAQEYKEQSYDDLLNELTSRTKKSQSYYANESLDSIKIHVGFGALASANKIKIQDKTLIKEQSGFQLSMGLDLFSQNWATEIVIRNFGQTESATEIRSLREYDLIVLFKDKLENQMGYRFGMGLGTRYLRISDNANNIFIDSSTPTGVLFIGAEAFLSQYLSIIFDMGTRTALITDTVDKNSIDLGLNLVTNF
jgi:hypothetical protein